jgi:hypothetical protein
MHTTVTKYIVARYIASQRYTACHATTHMGPALSCTEFRILSQYPTFHIVGIHFTNSTSCFNVQDTK